MKVGQILYQRYMLYRNKWRFAQTEKEVVHSFYQVIVPTLWFQMMLKSSCSGKWKRWRRIFFDISVIQYLIYGIHQSFLPRLSLFKKNLKSLSFVSDSVCSISIISSDKQIRLEKILEFNYVANPFYIVEIVSLQTNPVGISIWLYFRYTPLV